MSRSRGSQRHANPAHELNCRRDVAKMNIIRRVAAIYHGRKLELLLILSIALLIGQLSLSSVFHWWRFPGPGTTRFDTFQAATLEPEFKGQLLASFDAELQRVIAAWDTHPKLIREAIRAFFS